MAEIDIDILRKLIRYEPESGRLFWLNRDVSMFLGTVSRTPEHLCKWWNNRFAEKEAFTSICGSGAFNGKIFGESIYAHRIAWALHHGTWPCEDIDHINGNRLDNRAVNLRVVNHQQNMQNKKRYKSCKSGTPGVAWNEPRRRFQVYITVNKHHRHIGWFKILDDAIAARRIAERDAGCFHPNHGRG